MNYEEKCRNRKVIIRTVTAIFNANHDGRKLCKQCYSDTLFYRNEWNTEERVNISKNLKKKTVINVFDKRLTSSY